MRRTHTCHACMYCICVYFACICVQTDSTDVQWDECGVYMRVHSCISVVNALSDLPTTDVWRLPCHWGLNGLNCLKWRTTSWTSSTAWRNPYWAGPTKASTPLGAETRVTPLAGMGIGRGWSLHFFWAGLFEYIWWRMPFCFLVNIRQAVFEEFHQITSNYIYHHNNLLVGGLEHFLFSHILGIIIPTD